MSRDDYKQIVYDWQNETLPRLRGEGISLEDAQALADTISSDYGGPTCRIELGRADKRRSSEYYHGRNLIRLAPSWGLNWRTVLHEIAHHIDHHLYNGRGHTSTFIRVYIDLLVKYADCSMERLIRSVNANGLHVHGQEPDFIIDDGKVHTYPF